MKEITTFVEMSRREQVMRLNRKVPSIDEFWEYRLGSSAVCVTLAINEYVSSAEGLHPPILERLVAKQTYLKIHLERHASPTLDNGR